MTDGFIFYASFYEAITELEDHDQLAVYRAICEYALNGNEPELTGVASAMFKLMKPQIDRGIHLLEGQNGRFCKEYTEWRKSVFERDGYTCRKCGRRGARLNAHHIKPYAKYKGLRYELSNGITLCEKCHREVHYGEK